MNIDQAWRRYNNDSFFNQIVKTFYQLMYNMQFTHEELRDAAFLAAVQIEGDRPAPHLIKIKPWYSEEEKLRKENIDGRH